MQITDVRTGELVPTQDGAPRWRPLITANKTHPPYKWELFIPVLIGGVEIGGLGTDIWVYEYGGVCWPGREVPNFANVEEAKAFVEATWLMEGGAEDAR